LFFFFKATKLVRSTENFWNSFPRIFVEFKLATVQFSLSDS